MDEENESPASFDGMEKPEGGTPLDYPTLFIPKAEGYSVPDSGRGIVDFKKISEDENGCTVQLTAFEGEEQPDINSYDDSMEDAMEHVDTFIDRRDKMKQEKGEY